MRILAVAVVLGLAVFFVFGNGSSEQPASPDDEAIGAVPDEATSAGETEATETTRIDNAAMPATNRDGPGDAGSGAAGSHGPATSPGTHAPQMVTRLEVRIAEIPRTRGQILVALYNNASDWATDMKSQRTENEHQVQQPAANTNGVTVTFDVEPGRYAVSLFHDEDESGTIRKVLGIPTEGYGFSRNYNPIPLGPPTFDKVAVRISKGETKQITIRLR